MRFALPIPYNERLVESLTRRELEVLELMCDGLSNEEISRHLDVSLATTKFHLLNIYGKLGVKRRTQAVALAIYLDLVQPHWLRGGPVRDLPPSFTEPAGLDAC